MGTSILDLAEAFALAHQVAVMRDGRVVQAGSPEQAYRADLFVGQLLGEATSLERSAGGGQERLRA